MPSVCRTFLQSANIIGRFDMVKRLAEDSLEDVVAQDSPASKKVRLDEHQTITSPVINGTHSANGGDANDLEHVGNGHGAFKELQEEDLVEAVPLEEDDEEEAQDEQSAYSATSRQQAPTEGYSDLYLDTIDRSVLDFDFEKLCSITLSNINVYACLVCGRYYQGRGSKSHAYFHALEVGHHVYVNMQTKKVYVLPEGYEVKSKSLDDIKFVVDPRLAKEEVVTLDGKAKDAWDLAGKKYTPGQGALETLSSSLVADYS